MTTNEKPLGRFRSVKAYKNEAFMASPDARLLRILSEYIEPASRFEDLQVRDTIVIFGSARILPRDKAEAALEAARAGGGDVAKAERMLKMSHYYECTRELAFRLTEWSKSLDVRVKTKAGEKEERRFVICSGGGPGIMEAANRGASEAKGVNIGLNIALPFEQEVNPWITRRLAFEFHYFFMRKYWFAYLAKGIVAMPGGFGTLDEFMEIVTLIQTLKIKKKLPMVLFGTEYWDEIINFDAMAKWGMINPEDLNLFHRTDSVDDAFEYITRELRHYLDDPQPVTGLDSPIKPMPTKGSIDGN
ncbi:MAG TPA: LOG family protein [Planctomycetota bacterium]|nr:LOG family protein [Planctomycetota bacterium]